MDLTGFFSAIAMHIVIDARTTTDHFPGIGRYVLNLTYAMAAMSSDVEVSLLCNSVTKNHTRFKLPDLELFPCPVTPFSLRQQWIVPRILRQANVACYHSSYYLMPLALPCPTVLTCYDVIPLVYPRYFTAFRRCLFRLSHVMALRAASGLIAISDSTKEGLIRFFHTDPDRITVIPLAANHNYKPCTEREVERVKGKHGLPDRYVLYVGMNKPHKNLIGLVKAWKAVNSKLKTQNSKLVIAGCWDNRYPEAKALVSEYGLEESVLFTGRIDEEDLPSLYSGASLFVFPSQYEGFGLPVLEAMACGTPVACSNTSSLPEVGGDAVAYFDPSDTSAMAEIIAGILADRGERQRMKEAGLAQAAQFTWESTALQTLAVYEKAQG